ncbi:ComF family protein, partial [Streptomyces cavourensis]
AEALGSPRGSAGRAVCSAAVVSASPSAFEINRN